TQPALACARAILHEVLLEAFALPVGESAPALDAALAREKLAGGLPLFRGVALTLEPKALRQRWSAVCAAVQRQNNDAQAVAAAFTDLSPGALLEEVLAGRPQSVPAKAELLHLDPALTATIFRFAFFPVLAHLAAEVAPVRRQAPWEHGYCPVCGSWPLLGEFRGLEQ